MDFIAKLREEIRSELAKEADISPMSVKDRDVEERVDFIIREMARKAVFEFHY